MRHEVVFQYPWMHGLRQVAFRYLVSLRISSTNLANDELRFWRFDIYKACIAAKTWQAFYYRYSMSMVFRSELATSWQTTMRQTIPASILSYNSFTRG